MPLYVGSRAAADFGNAAFRAWWIAKAQAALAAGYKGLFIDDVFMERRTYLSGGTTLRNPKDPRTGTTMTEANWQKYLADFMVAVRAALPNAEIAHDVLWQKGDSGDVLRGLQAANAVSVDGGFTTNVVTSGFATLASWAERVQARGGSVVFDHPTASAPGPPVQLRRLHARRQRRLRARQRRVHGARRVLVRLRRRPRRPQHRALPGQHRPVAP